jgi:hypothetical protein
MSFNFNGPVCKTLLEFMKNVQDIPSQHKQAFETVSKNTIGIICEVDALHIWESDSDMDNLLQLTQVIVKLRNLSSAMMADGKTGKNPAMIIIAEEKKDRNNYGRIVELVKYLTGNDGKEHLNNTVTAFNSIVVVRGVDSDETAAVKRINIAIERTFQMVRPSSKKLIWHHGPFISLLLTWINTTKPELRANLHGITVTAALDLFTGVKPSPLGTSNKVADLQRLEDYAKKLKIPVLLLDPGCGLIAWDNLARYMYYWVYYINTFFPATLLQPHLYKALDELVTFSFRIRGASEGKYGNDVVRMVQAHLDASTARRWARTCVAASSYTKDLCRAAGTDIPLQHAFQLSDCPFALFTQNPGYNLPAFSRIPICPSNATVTTNPTHQYYVAAPTSFSFSTSSFRPSTHSPFRILLPKAGQTVDLVTERIQGIMMAVLTSVMKDRAPPRFGDVERAAWDEVGTACCWALEGCKGRCPKGVEGKIKYVVEQLRGGRYKRTIEGRAEEQRGAAADANTAAGWGGESGGGWTVTMGDDGWGGADGGNGGWS